MLFQPFEPPLACSTPKRIIVKEGEKEQQKEKEMQEVQGDIITLEEGVDGENNEPNQEATLSVDEACDSFYVRFLCNPLFWDMTVVCQV